MQDEATVQGLENLKTEYAAVGQDINHALDLYLQASPDAHNALTAAAEKLNDARRHAADTNATLTYGTSLPAAGPTATP